MYTCFVIIVLIGYVHLNDTNESDCSEFQNNGILSVRLSVGLCRNRSSVENPGFLIKDRGF